MRKNLVLKVFFCVERNSAVCKLFKHLVIVLGVDYYGYVLIVFSRRAYHCRPAYIYVFNTFGEVRALCKRGFERI